MLEDDGPAIYGAFIAVVLMCSKQSRPRDGHLTDTGGAKGRPLAPKEISVKTKVPPNLIKRMLDVTCSESIGWIRVLGSVPAECPPSVEEGKGREGKGREEEGRYSTSNPDLFWNLLSDLEDKPTISLAVECVRLANDSFKNVGTMFLENSFRGQPDKMLWAPAVRGLAEKFAGVKMEYPNRSLQNWLAGKPEKNPKPKMIDPKDPLAGMRE